jgi:peptide/nickel transport system substrate-binding protein
MEYLGQKWKAIGVDVKLVGEDEAKYGESLGVTESWDVSWVGLGLSLPTQMVGNFSGPGPDKKGGNFGHVNNAEYVKLTGAAAKAVGAASCPMWAAAETALIKNLDVVPVVQPTQLVASKGASLDVIGGIVRPTSIRMLAP